MNFSVFGMFSFWFNVCPVGFGIHQTQGKNLWETVTLICITVICIIIRLKYFTFNNTIFTQYKKIVIVLHKCKNMDFFFFGINIFAKMHTPYCAWQGSLPILLLHF